MFGNARAVSGKFRILVRTFAEEKFEILAPINQINQSNAKLQPMVTLGRTRFPALGAGYMHLLQVLIGSMFC